MTKPMNKIDLPAAPTAQVGKLIEELCPQGVEIKGIGEICQINRGRVMSKDYLRDNAGVYPVYSSQTVDDGVFGRINTYDYDGEYLTWTTDGANAGSIFYRNGKFSITNVCGLLKVKVDDVNTKFLLYILATVSKKYVSAGMGNPKIMSNVMEKIQIPIPPLTIQKEIVKILDNFTQLEAELEAELEARKKQYEHYREALLSFGDDVEFRALGEVCKFLRGSAITKKKTSVGEIPVVANAPGPICFHGESNRTGETIVVSRSGAYCGLVSFWNQPIFITDAFSIYLETTLLKPKFIYYFLKKNQKTIHSMKKGFGVPHVRVKDFETYSIPIPPLSKQKEIVAILDKFDALVNDISTGLPAEIAARKKQYEYYRNQLLTFKPLEAQDAN